MKIGFLALLFIAPFKANCQGLVTDYGNYVPCSGPIALYTFDFSSTGSNTITQAGINIANSDNQCCGLPTNHGCLFFNVIVDPGASGVNFSQTGAGGSVVIYYDNCAAQYPANSPICLDPSNAYIDPVTGQSYHRFMFCRTGQTTYDFTFTQIVPTFPTDVGVTEGCTIPLSVADLDPATVVWTSVSPGPPGTWNSLLNCTTGCLDVVVTPTSGSPSTVSYQVCGNLTGACNADTYCDTVTITIYPDLFADAGPDMAFCLGSLVPITSTGTALGGTPAFTYTWNGISGNGAGFTYTTVSVDTFATVNINQTGVYQLIITDVNGCATAYDTMEVFEYATDIQAYITTGNVSICHVPTPTITINGYVTETETGVWSSSNGGTFGTVAINSPGAVAGVGPAVATTWTPTPGTTGLVTLTLTPTNNANCPITPASITIDLTDFTATLALTPTDVLCNGGTDGAINLVVTPGVPAYGIASYLWSTGNGSGLVVGNEDQTTLTDGTYQVVVTDVNGCFESISTSLIEPLPLVVTIAGDVLLCNGDANGNVTGTISGGTAPYTITLDQTGASQVVAVSGGAYDFSALSAAISGGFDTYSVTVTDANGSTNGCLEIAGPVNMIEPLPLVVTIAGDVLLCNGDANGNVTGTISGGTAPYTITLDQTGASQVVAVSGGAYDFSALSAAISGGFDTYSVTVTDANGSTNGCLEVAGPVNMIEPLPLVVTIAGDVLLCNGDANGNVTGTISGGTAPYTVTLDQTGASQVVAVSGGAYDFSALSAAISGGFDTYSVTVTDANGSTNGCLELAGPVNMIEPLPLVVTIAGDVLLCNGDANGNVTGTISGGTAPYTITLDQTGASQVIAVSGGAYDFSALSAAISGGFDTYSVTVTDANGSTNGCLEVAGPVNMIEPLPLVVTIAGDVLLCNGDANGNVTGTISGGTAPYTITLDQTGASQVIAVSGGAYDFSALSAAISGGFDTYSVTVTDANGSTNGCLEIAGPVNMIEPLPLVVTITGDVLLCNGDANGNVTGTISGGTAPYTITLDQTGASQVVAVSGGAYDFSALSAAISGGFDTYSVTVTDANGSTNGCLELAGPVNMIEPLPLVVTIAGDVLLCNGDANGNVTGTISGGTAPYTITLDQTGASQVVAVSGGAYDFSALSAAISGGFDTYSVTVTDANGSTNGCLELAGPVNMIEPLPLVVTIAGDVLLCNGDANGNVTGTISGGTAPYTITLDQTGASQVVAVSGGAYDFSALSAAISGGFDTYSVTVTDANGSTNGCLEVAGPVNMIEPLPLVVTIAGDVLLCNGDANGNVTGTISGGTAPYTITLDQTGASQVVAVSGGAYDFSALSAAISGGFDTYSVTVTDANGSTNGCLELAGPVNMIEPLPLVVTIAGDVLLCNGDANGNVTGTISGGTAPYTITLDQTGASQVIAVSGGAYDFSALSAAISGGFDTYSVTVTDANGSTNGCLELAGPVNMIEPLPLVVTIVGDVLLCNGDANGNVTGTISGGTAPYTITLDQTGASQVIAVSGGAYDFSALSAAISGGFDTYSVTVTDANGSTNGCLEVAGPVNMIEPLPLVVTIAGDVLLCNGDANGNVTGTISGGTAPYTITLDQTGASQVIAVSGGAYDFSALSAAISGGFDTYSVTVTDANGSTNGCLELAGPVNMIEPLPLVVTIAGDVLLCNGDANGNVTGTISGGTAPYTITLDQTGASQVVAVSGGAYDFSALSAAISGGFDTYSVTVTDANGSTNGCLELAGPVNMIEPLPLVVTIAGDVLLCNGDANGNVTGTISGGTAPYTITLDQTGASQVVAVSGGAYDFSALSAAISGGFDTYSVTVTDANGSTNGCLEVAGPVNMIEPLPLVVTIAGDVLLCNGDANGNVTGTISGGTAPYTITLDQTGASQVIAVSGGAYDFSALSAAISGGFDTYSVTVTDANGSTNGCLELAGPVNMIEPLPLVVTIAGDVLLCNGDANGNVTGTISGGTAPYTITLDQTGASQVVAVSGGAYDFSALSAAISGGFDTYSVTVTDANGSTNGCLELAGPVNMIEPLPLVVTIAGDVLLCNGDANGNVTGTISGGTAPYTITLDQTGASQVVAVSGGAYDFSALSAAISGGFDTYSVTVTDANGSTNGCLELAGPVNMIEPAALGTSLTPSVYAGGWNVTGCVNDGTIDLVVTGGTAGFVFDWSNDGTGDFDDTEDLINLFPGWYVIDLIDMNGCTISDSIELLAPAILNSSTLVTTNYNGQDVSCEGASDGGVEVMILDGTPTYTYEWTDALGNVISTNSTVNAIPAGYYFVLATDLNGCTVYDSIEVVDAPPLNSTIVVSSDYNGQDISCFSYSDGSIDFNVMGGTPGYTYAWVDQLGNSVGVTEDLMGLPAGTYFVEMSDLNGCRIDTSITLTEPPLLDGITSVTSDYNGEDISCFGYSDGSVEVVANGGTPILVYEWVDAMGNVLGTSPTLAAVPVGTYSVEVTDINGCQIIRDIVVSQPPQLVATIDVLTDYFGVAVSCQLQTDGEIEAIATGGTPGFTYEWDTNPVETTALISNLGEGTYTVVITDVNGCTATQNVTLVANPLPIINPDPGMEVCQGETVTFGSNASATENCTWLFSNGIQLNDCGPNTLLINDVGCYDANLIVTNEFGCVDSVYLTDYVCIRPNPIAAFSASSSVVSVLEPEISFYNESTGAISYHWDFGDGTSTTTFDATHQYTFDQPNVYDVVLTATNEYGCVDTALMTYEVRDVLLYYVPNTFTPDGDAYNNTFHPVFGSGVSTKNYEFLIFNRWGELIFSTNDPYAGWDGTYRNQECQDGTYTWKLVFTASKSVIESGERADKVGHVNLIR